MELRYHHGDLRATVLREAARQVAAEGPDAVSLRGIARRAGVSHAAPAHHFGDRRGLFTALAVQGHELLADALAAAGPDLKDVAVAYVRFALDHPGPFAVMFRGDLVRADDAALARARERSGAALRSGLEALGPDRTAEQQRTARLAAWSVVHGFVSLWRAEALTGSELVQDSPDPEVLARRVVEHVDLS